MIAGHLLVYAAAVVVVVVAFLSAGGEGRSTGKSFDKSPTVNSMLNVRTCSCTMRFRGHNFIFETVNFAHVNCQINAIASFGERVRGLCFPYLDYIVRWCITNCELTFCQASVKSDLMVSRTFGGNRVSRGLAQGS